MPDFFNEKSINDILVWGVTKGHSYPLGLFTKTPPLDTDHLHELYPTGPVRSNVPDSNDHLGKICESCPNQYSLAFKVVDADDRPCAGMYYTVMCGTGPTDKNIKRGTTDKDGLTERHLTSKAGTIFYLFLGHRTDKDGYPIIQASDENKYDEAPLWHDTVAPIPDKKVCQAKTKRKWKPWTASSDAREWMKKEEGFKREPYNDHLGYATIGIGHLLHKSPVNKDDLQKYPQPLEDEQVQELFDSDVLTRAGGDAIKRALFVPLYQREFDALIDQGFQFGAGTIINESSSFKKNLNRGRYTSTSNVFLQFKNANGKFDQKVLARSTRNSDTFIKGSYKGPSEK